MTDITALIQELIDAGCDPAVAGSVVARVLATGVSTAPYRAKTNAERQADYRERHPVTPVTKSNESNETVTPVTAPLSLLDYKTKKDKKERERGTRLPADWEPSSEDLKAARGYGMPEDVIPREAEKFRNYWTARADAKAVKTADRGWPATWRNWCITVCEERGYCRGPPKHALPPDEIARLRARYEERKAKLE